MTQLNELNVTVDFGCTMNSLSVPDKYLEEAIRPVKADFPLTYDLCWTKHEHLENEIVIDDITNEIICVLLWENVDNGLNNFVKLHSIEVNKNWRNGGLGSVILQEFMADKHKIYAASTKDAEKFYTRNGFKYPENHTDYAYYIKEK